MMESFPSQKVLLRAYWRKLTISIGAACKSHGRVSAGRATRVLQTRHGRASRSEAVTARVRSANAFQFGTRGPQVATIENEDRIHWQNIRVGRDFGDRIEVLDGLKENTKVVINPTDDLREGLQVEVKLPEQPKPDGRVAQSSSGH
jgi:hypothetical protein